MNSKEILTQAAIHPEMMTLFYRKKTGEIKIIMSDACTFDAFGNEKEDYEQIWDYIQMPVDEVVRRNRAQFMVDVETKELVYTPTDQFSQYRTR